MPPAGIRERDGHSTVLTFALSPNLSLWEVRIKLPGIDFGGPNNVTTMRNVAWRTRQPKKLKTLTPITGTCQYNLDVYGQIIAMGPTVQAITLTAPSTRTITFYGWLDKFDPQENVEGEPPTATFTVEPSNEYLGVEVGPVVS